MQYVQDVHLHVVHVYLVHNVRHVKMSLINYHQVYVIQNVNMVNYLCMEHNVKNVLI